MLKTDRQDLTAEEIWRTYMLLTRVEAAFRAMKSPLMERPIFHPLEIRSGTSPEPIHKQIYSTLKIPLEVIKTRRSWEEMST